MPKMGRSVTIDYATDDVIYTARAGLVPINEAARTMKVHSKIDAVCKPLRQKGKINYRSSQLCMFVINGILSGLPRIGSMINSAEFPFLLKLVDMKSEPAASTFTRFFRKFSENTLSEFQNITFSLGKTNSKKLGGYQVLVHDQSAIQKYGNLSEGVEKGYGGTIKKGSKMLQASLIIDAGNQKVLSGEIKPGKTHTSNEAPAEIEKVLSGLDGSTPILVLADSGYGIGGYMRACDRNKAKFILGVKNDSWMKNELEELDFKRFHIGKLFDEYGYREFEADRDCWNKKSEDELNLEEEWEGKRRIIVVKLPPAQKKDKDSPVYLFLATNLSKDEASAEEVHAIYRKDRETIEQVNDELKNQLKISELPSMQIDSNRAFAQLFFIAWNLQRDADIVSISSLDKSENEVSETVKHGLSTLPVKSMGYRSPLRQRREWWSLFCSYIAVGGRFTSGGNRHKVVVSGSERFKEWCESITNYRWEAI